jgi:hypothetical protein
MTEHVWSIVDIVALLDATEKKAAERVEIYDSVT